MFCFKYPRYALLVLLFVVNLVQAEAAGKQQLLMPDNGMPEDAFGYSVAIDGSHAVVGAMRAEVDGLEDAGVAYIYALQSGVWQQKALLQATNPVALDTLGGNVAISGDTVALGAMRNDVKGDDAGAVFLFEKSGQNWNQKSVLHAIDGVAGDAFGQSIAINERFLVIGAPRADPLLKDIAAKETATKETAIKDTGSVYIYERVRDNWQYSTKLTANDGAAGDLFGISVDVDGNTLLVGADLHDEKAENAGAVYVFTFQQNSWQQQAKLTAEDAGKTDIFGVRVAISGDTAVISARRDDHPDIGIDAGSAYIFQRKNGKWSQQAKLLAPDIQADDRFGRGVALQGDIAAISAMHQDSKAENAGAVYLFKRHADDWHFLRKILADDGAARDVFGWNLAYSGNHIIVGAPGSDKNGPESGAAWVIALSESDSDK